MIEWRRWRRRAGLPAHLHKKLNLSCILVFWFSVPQMFNCGRQAALRVLSIKRRHAEALAATMSSADTILILSNLKVETACIADHPADRRASHRRPLVFFLKRWSKQMNLPRLWTTGQDVTWDPFRAVRREMENALRTFDQNASSPDIGAGEPAISVAETKDAFEVTAELPGVDEKDIKVSLDDNQLVISGEKNAESTKEEKAWHVEERSYGSFYRSISLPFEPEDGAVDAHFDKGVLHLMIKKPAKSIKSTKTIDIKTGAPPTTSSAPRKAA
jgi:HSP20 family protein